MALLDDKEYILAFIKNSFITSDDTELCELILENDDLKRNRSNKKRSTTNDSSTEEISDSELMHSFEIIPNMDIDSHRRRTDTAQRLERMKRDKHRLSQVQHIAWKLSEDNETDEVDFSDLFIRKEIIVETAPRVSLLSEQLKQISSVSQNPFNEFIKFDGKAVTTMPTKRIQVYLMMVCQRDRPFPLTVCCLASARISDFIGLICWHYTCSGLQPPLHKTSNAYALHIAEEDGEMDMDFPALEFNETLAKYGFNQLALVERDKSLWSTHQTIVVTINMPGRGFSKIPLENTNIKMKELLAIVLTKRRIQLKNGINYRLEEQEQYGVAVDLDQPLSAMSSFHFCLVRENSVRGTEDERSSLDDKETCPLVESLTSHLYKTFNVDLLLRLWTRNSVQLAISGDKIEIDSMPKINKKSILFRKSTRHVLPSSKIVNCSMMEPRHAGKSVFRIDYVCGTDYKHHTFECHKTIAMEIVRKLSYIVDQQIDMSARKTFLSYRESRIRQ